MQLSFKEHFQLIVFHKLWDWWLEKSCMRNHTCLLDHHQRSHYDTITIGPEGVINWVLQLNNSQSVNSFNSLVEKFNTQRSPNKPNQSPNQSVIDQGNLIARKMFVDKGETSRTHEIDEKGFHGELCSSDRSVKPDNLSENTHVEQIVEQIHDGSGQPDERNSSSAHIVKEQFAPEENRDIALFNTDNEFNRAINEEDIDFNIPGLPHSAVKQLHGASVRDLIEKIENHPHRHALQWDLQQRQQFNPFSKESKDMICDVGNIELCELLDVEPKAQCKVCLSYWDVGIVYCTCGHFLRDDTTEKKKYIMSVLHLLSIPNYYIKKGRHHGHRYGKKPGYHEYFIANSLKKKCKKKHFLGIHDRFIRDEKFRKSMFDVGRNEEMSWDGHTSERRPHAPHHSRWNSSVSKQLVDPFEHSWFRHDAREASSWFQTSIVYLATPQEPRGYSLLPKVGKLFLVLVELGRILVAFFIWASPRRWTTHWLIGETWWTVIGPIIRGMFLRINLVQNYSSKFGNSQQQFTVTDGWGVNTFPPIQQNFMKNGYDENNGYGKVLWEQVCDELEHHHKPQVEWREQQHAAHQAHTNDDVDTLLLHFNGRVAYMHWACT